MKFGLWSPLWSHLSLLRALAERRFELSSSLEAGLMGFVAFCHVQLPSTGQGAQEGSRLKMAERPM